MKYVAIIVFVLLMASSTGSCLSSGGVYWRLDGQQHSFVWWNAKVPIDSPEGGR